MTWGVYVHIDPRPPIQMFDAVEGEMKRWPYDDLRKLAVLAAERIDVRTAKGLDMYYEDFVSYSEEYEEWKRDHKDLDEGDTMTVDLTLHGQMRAAKTPQVDSGEAVVGFTDRFQAIKADAHHHGKGHLPERPWFGIDENTKDMEKLQEEALFLMSRRIENLGRFK